MQFRQASDTTAGSDATSGGAARGLLVVLSGPSGVGKTTLAKAIIGRFDATFSVSATTRAPGAGEVDGRDYFFISTDEFDAMRKRDAFLECAQVFGRDWYGTPSEPVQQQLTAGRIVLLDIDVQGGLQVRRAMPEAYMLFIMPPSDDELLRRLQTRGRDDAAAIQRRFAEAKSEMALARESGAYDAIIVNDNLEQTIERVCELVGRARDRAGLGGSHR